MISHAALAEIAAAVYRGPWSGRVGGDVKFDLLPRGQDELVVALPGTDPADVMDWLRDATLWPVWARGVGYLHAGFGLGAWQAWRKMAPILGRDRLLTFTGHSLGGAMAACLAAFCARERPGAPFRIITFGQPRVAFLNPWFGHLLGQAKERAIYARRGDPVPAVPPWLYLHGGRTTRIGKPCANLIANHDIKKYVADLRALDV